MSLCLLLGFLSLPLSLRFREVEKELNHFVKNVAPVEIDKTSGDVRRRVKKIVETYHIGRQKEQIRWEEGVILPFILSLEGIE